MGLTKLQPSVRIRIHTGNGVKSFFQDLTGKLRRVFQTKSGLRLFKSGADIGRFLNSLLLPILKTSLRTVVPKLVEIAGEAVAGKVKSKELSAFIKGASKEISKNVAKQFGVAVIPKPAPVKKGKGMNNEQKRILQNLFAGIPPEAENVKQGSGLMLL